MEISVLQEEEVLRNPYSVMTWWSYLAAASDVPFLKRRVIYERALKSLPGSYKIWCAYLREYLNLVSNLPITNSLYQTLNNLFERALASLHKMPRIWIMYLTTLTDQKLVTLTRRTFDRALRALPVTQHDRIWGPYLAFISLKGIPVETSLCVYKRYLIHNPTHVEELIDHLLNSELWQEAAQRLVGILDDASFYCSMKGKTKQVLWLELCHLLTGHAHEISGFNLDVVLRDGIGRLGNEVGSLWTSLANCYIKRNLFGKARDVFEEGMASVVTLRDFNIIFDAYLVFEENMIMLKTEEENENRADCDDADRFDDAQPQENLRTVWLADDEDWDLMFARLVHLMERRPLLSNGVALRANPHDVEQWHRRAELYKDDLSKQILTYTQAVKTIDPMKAVGKPHTLWVAFAKLYEDQKDIANARVIFDKAVQVDFKEVDNLASLWCEWAEMELRNQNFTGALDLIKRATAEPPIEVPKRVAADRMEPVQVKLHRSQRLWMFYVDLEESGGSLESTRAVYERILDLKLATPQIIVNYALLLEEHKHFDDAFKVFERGVKIFKYPHVKDIWTTYLAKYVTRFGSSKLECARELFERAIETAPAESVKPLYLQYAKFEEDHGLATRAMKVYEESTKVVPAQEKMSMYELYIARVAEICGVPKTRKIFERAIEESGGLAEEDVKVMCMRYAELEKSLGEIDRARGIYVYAASSQSAVADPDIWEKWHEFEVAHGTEDTFWEYLRMRRSLQKEQDVVEKDVPSAVVCGSFEKRKDKAEGEGHQTSASKKSRLR